jgi:LCP family protein required for cell wall assembly
MSSLIPGLGQAWNGQRTMAVRMAVPFLVVVALVGLVLVIVPGPRLIAGAIVPSTLQGLLALNLVVLGWRLVALGQAFFDRGFALRPGRLGLGGLALVVLVTAAPHLAAGYVGGLARDTFARVFDAATLGGVSAGPGPTPGSGERINVLLMGVDAGDGRDHALTDTMIVVSVDPVGRSVSMASVPRDLVDVPLGDGRTFGPKLNSLMSYAGRHPEEFPKGGIRALEDAIGALLGIPIHYYATADMGGFVRMIDAVGGVDVNVKQALDDPKYQGFGIVRGWSVTVGRHHLDGAEALAYARIRRSEGQTDFTRADRQQEVLVALRSKVARGDALFSLPGLLDAVGRTIKTDLPPERLPDLAVLADEVDAKHIVRVVVRWPLVHPGEPGNRYGAVQVPRLDRILAMARDLFSPPGTPPKGWTPTSSFTPEPTPSPNG